MTNFQRYEAPVEPENEVPYNPIRILDTVTRNSLTDGEFTEDQTTIERGNSNVNPFADTASIFATARNPDGSAAAELREDTLIEVNGLQASIGFWVKQGLLQRSSDGSFTEANGNPEETPQDNSGDLLPISEQTMAAINDALEPLDQSDLAGVAATGIAVAVGRLDDAALLQRFQQATGQDSAQASARLDVLKTAYSAQASEALTGRYGVGAEDVSAFFAWCKANRQGQLMDAVGKQVYNHDVSGYRTLANAFLTSNPPSLDALKASGIPTRKQGQGAEVFVRGSWMTPGAAARAGLI